jgi:hypothetical protein
MSSKASSAPPQSKIFISNLIIFPLYQLDAPCCLLKLDNIDIRLVNERLGSLEYPLSIPSPETQPLLFVHCHSIPVFAVGNCFSGVVDAERAVLRQFLTENRVDF